MTTEPIGVGIIGVGSANSWAREAHVPAVEAVAGLQLVAVAATSEDRAAEVAKELGVERHYADAAALIADPGVQLVVVGAPVPAHAELIAAAAAAGKPTVSEWPLGTATEQSASIAESVSRAGVGGAVDLQARHAAAVLHAQRLVAQGRIGELLSVSVLSTTAGWGPEIPQAAEYLEDAAVGMNLATIQTAHTLDLAILLGGRLDDLSTMTSVRHPRVRVAGTDRTVDRVVPDHIVIQGHLAGGIPLVIEVRGGVSPTDAPFRMEIVGTRGSLKLLGGAARGFQAGEIDLRIDGEPVEVHRPYASLPVSARNVAGMYEALVSDLRDGTALTVSFEQAVALSSLVDDMQSAARSGSRISNSGQWPERG